MRVPRGRFRPILLLASTVVAIGLGALPAAAATRYAAPGAKGADPCADPENPCPLFRAVEERMGARSGDEIILAPGTYLDENGDMGEDSDPLGRFHEVRLAPGVTLHGEEGAPRPVLAFVNPNAVLSGFRMTTGDTVRGITVVGFGVEAFRQEAGLAEQMIVESEGVAEGSPSGGVACEVNGGVFRGSVCLASDEGEIALSGFDGAKVKLRNVTAIASAPNSVGIRYNADGLPGPIVTNIDAKSVIASGTLQDIVAEGSRGGTVHITLDHSDFDKVKAFADPGGSVATVTPPGFGTNITAAPMFAGDGFHELAESPTIDKGAADTDSGEFDIDGRGRSVGPAADIGADEFILSTTASLSCEPSLIVVKAVSSCTATVSDVGSTVDPPRGEVSFDSNGGEFDATKCTLAPFSGSQSKCTVKFKSGSSGAFLVLSEYPGDDNHGRSSDLTTVTAFPAQLAGTPEEELSALGAPGTLLRQLPKSKAKPRLAKFLFVSDQPGSKFECALDKGGFKPCTSPAKVLVRPGAHRFTVRAENLGHLVDPTPAVVRWRVAAAGRLGHRLQ
jgi:hypothetical protein